MADRAAQESLRAMRSFRRTVGVLSLGFLLVSVLLLGHVHGALHGALHPAPDCQGGHCNDREESLPLLDHEAEGCSLCFLSVSEDAVQSVRLGAPWNDRTDVLSPESALLCGRGVGAKGARGPPASGTPGRLC